ncbi:MAG TPA: DUF167 domain-containing protein [Patescibacteria group bacterium]|nr:DUF167 domain-containing protein [Patescibacteria group bacterium]
MRLSVRVKANAKENKVQAISQGELALWVKAAPKENKANAAVVGLLSEYLDIPKSRIIIIRGLTSRNKVVDVKDYER